ncbi:MAG: hypothetical protein CMJ18_27545 [Phycisphaeraceae bacterium]|nr:hypothetical protein [Phycisphaeraceae bacterium]
MKSFRNRTAACTSLAAALLLTTASTALTGCKGIPIRLVEPDATLSADPVEPAPDPIAGASIATAARAIQAGDLAAADQHLEVASEHANTDEQQAQIRSLARLLDGAEAMMAGRPRDAAASWGRIDDDDLKQQVSRAAGRLDVDVHAATPGPAPAR